jgi:TonB family protein
MRSRVLFSLILLLAGTASAFARDDQRELVGQWQQRMAETESALRSGDYSQAMRLSNRTVSEMVERLGPGEGSTRLFGSALLHKALAHAGLGEHDEAAWYGQVVLGLDPAFAETDLSMFGETARLLAPSLEQRGVSSAVSPGQQIEAPKLVRRRKPKFPHGAHYFGVSGDLVVEVIVKSDGSVREPRIVTPLPAATLSYAALEAVKRWRFEPARAGGEPIDMVYNLTVNYKR